MEEGAADAGVTDQDDKPTSSSAAAAATTAPFTIIILTMNRLSSLQRLVQSLQMTDYGRYHQESTETETTATNAIWIDLVLRIDRPTAAASKETWQMHRNVVEWATTNLQLPQPSSDPQPNPWPWGNVTVHISNRSLGLRQAWLDAWVPPSTLLPSYTNTLLLARPPSNNASNLVQREPRAIILEDDITVSPLWYTWVNTMHDRYGHLPDLAGISLQRQGLVARQSSPQKNVRHHHHPQSSSIHNSSHSGGEPFLYQLIGSIGFSPIPRVWRDFVDFAHCSLCSGSSIATPGLQPWAWYQALDQRHMWTQHMIYYMQQRSLYTLYQFPTPPRQALAAHWREKGEHFGQTLGADFELVTDLGQLNLDGHVTSSSLTRYDFGMSPVDSKKTLRTAIITCAVNKDYTFDTYETFVGTLRHFYDGPILMMISNQADEQVRSFLHQHNVQTHETQEGRTWEAFNRFRFEFYKDSCSEDRYDWCLTIDFRDSIFQANPFDWPPLVSGDKDAFFFPHNRPWRRDNPEGGWHFMELGKCRYASLDMKAQWEVSVADQPLINAGGFYGRPTAFAAIQGLLLRPEMQLCNDQIVLNVGLYHNMTNLRYQVFPQGHGPINNIAWTSVYNLLNGVYRGRDCLVTAIAHQYNEERNRLPPSNQNCQT